MLCSKGCITFRKSYFNFLLYKKCMFKRLHQFFWFQKRLGMFKRLHRFFWFQKMLCSKSSISFRKSAHFYNLVWYPPNINYTSVYKGYQFKFSWMIEFRRTVFNNFSRENDLSPAVLADRRQNSKVRISSKQFYSY